MRLSAKGGLQRRLASEVCLQRVDIKGGLPVSFIRKGRHLFCFLRMELNENIENKDVIL